MPIKALKKNSYIYKVSVLIPAFNEDQTIGTVLSELRKALEGINFEIIVIDDGSVDRTEFCVKKFQQQHSDIHLTYFKQENLGKGGAIRTGIKQARGEVIVVQDADLEYSPRDLIALLAPFDEGADVVYGSRNLVKRDRDHSSLIFYWGGILVTKVTNLLFGSSLTDEATGYKLFKSSLFQELSFEHNDFAWEPEITAKILKENLNIIELPISYRPRSKKEGKKISWTDGVKAIWVLFYERFIGR